MRMVKKVSSAAHSKQRLKCESTTVKKGRSRNCRFEQGDSWCESITWRCRVESLKPGSCEERAAAVQATAPKQSCTPRGGRKTGLCEDLWNSTFSLLSPLLFLSHSDCLAVGKQKIKQERSYILKMVWRTRKFGGLCSKTSAALFGHCENLHPNSWFLHFSPSSKACH